MRRHSRAAGTAIFTFSRRGGLAAAGRMRGHGPARSSSPGGSESTSGPPHPPCGAPSPRGGAAVMRGSRVRSGPLLAAITRGSPRRPRGDCPMGVAHVKSSAVVGDPLGRQDARCVRSRSWRAGDSPMSTIPQRGTRLMPHPALHVSKEPPMATATSGTRAVPRLGSRSGCAAAS